MAHAVCIEPTCSTYPFLCNHLCSCLDEHNGHHLIELSDYFKVANQPAKFSVSDLDNWFELVDGMIVGLQRQLIELRESHRDWFRGYLRAFLRESETEEILSSTNIEQIKNLTGRKLRRLFD